MYNSYLHGLIRNSGHSQRSFATHLGIHYTTLSQIINGRLAPRKHKEAIAKFFNKSVDTIFKRRTNG